MSETGDQRLRVLVLTNHFKWFAGSEIVALHAAQGFAAFGDEVTLAANVIEAPMREHAVGLHLTDNIADLDLTKFDLVWHQHDMLSLLPIAAFEQASRESAAHIASVSLSPFEPYEHINGVLAQALSAEVWANSPETADVIVEANRGYVHRSDICVFQNAAPESFWGPHALAGSSQLLRSVLVVSNHLPEELKACATLLEGQGVSVRRVGLGDEQVLLQPSDVARADAVVSIGKTVSYAIAAGKPVFIYDHFGGDGWLTRDNFEENRRFNFSGRPRMRRLDAPALATEILDGYGRAVEESGALSRTFDLSAFRLEQHLANLRKRAQSRDMRLRGLKLSFLLSQRSFRAHMETSRRKAEVMRSLRRQIDVTTG
ncbi:MAG: hypothetical protein JNM59_06105 [Hyphomonadaceae bacterium]|nr:hypothetical protein [Hyphomonadaceae bacterium]